MSFYIESYCHAIACHLLRPVSMFTLPEQLQCSAAETLDVQMTRGPALFQVTD